MVRQWSRDDSLTRAVRNTTTARGSRDVAVQLVFEMDRGEWEGREEFGCLVSGERERGGGVHER